MNGGSGTERANQAFARAQTLRKSRRYAEAVAAYQEAIGLAPSRPEFVLGYAELAEEVGDLGAAEQLYLALGRLRPDCGYEGRLGTVLMNARRHDDAVRWLQAANRKQPQDADILVNLGAALAYAGRSADSTNAFHAAWERRADPEILRRLLAVQINAGGDGGDETVRLGLARHPDSDAFRTMAAEHLLKSRRWREGFDLFHRARFHATTEAPGSAIDCPWWDGEPGDGPLLVIAEQGLGDEILASSLYADIARAGRSTLIECDARLLPVLRRSFNALAFAARGLGALDQGARESAGARKIRAMDLCRLFRRDDASFPARRAWLKADPARVEALRAAYRARWPGRRLVGISWKSMRQFAGEDVKSLALTDLRQTLQTPGTVFLSLQYGESATDLRAAADAGLLVEVDERIDPTQDIDALFAQAAALDVVVTTSNTTAHVAGSLGVPCLVALPGGKGVPWYWGYRGAQVPWYPSLRLFRNARRDTIPDLDAALAAALADLPPGAPPA